MPAPTTLKEIYSEELRDLWSANDQMHRLLSQLVDKASDPKLKQTLTQSLNGIGQHTDVLKTLVQAAGGETGKEHCKGMEGLTKEAKKHILDEELEGEVCDIEIIAQYQRMSHYGLAGFGTAAAYAKALGNKDDASKLKKAVEDIYQADEVASHLAQKSIKLAAKHAEAA